MARAKSKPPARRRAKPPSLVLPKAIAAQVATMSGLPEAVFLTRDRWEGGGVDILWANPAAVALTGFDLDQLVGRSTRVLHGVKTKPAPNQRRETGEDWIHRRNGTAFFAAWKFSPLLE